MEKFRKKFTRNGIRLHGEEDFAGMRKAGEFTAKILDDLCDVIHPGMRTLELNDIAHKMINERGATSATVGYRGYQHATCISVNHVICHGVPGKKILRNGDILNIDVTVEINGWYGDSSRMYAVGQPDNRALRLIKTTYDALVLGIQQVKPGNTFGDIGHAIQRHVERSRMSVVREYCGHGIGRAFHLPPNVLHYGKPGGGSGA